MEQISFPKPDEREINELVNKIVREVDPMRIIVFGSCGRNKQTQGSDLDLLVVTELPSNETIWSLRTKIRNLLSDRSFPLDLVIQTPELFERQKDQLGMLAETADREGEVLYQRSKVA
ncbi:MAG: nucleotidyltransferase domain-containing protein [bacterium]